MACMLGADYVAQFDYVRLQRIEERLQRVNIYGQLGRVGLKLRNRAGNDMGSERVSLRGRCCFFSFHYFSQAGR